jgi:hypothetical protein
VNKGIISFVPQGWVFPLFMKVNHYGLVVLRAGSVDIFKFHVQCSDCRAEYVSYGLGVEYKVIFGVATPGLKISFSSEQGLRASLIVRLGTTCEPEVSYCFYPFYLPFLTFPLPFVRMKDGKTKFRTVFLLLLHK